MSESSNLLGNEFRWDTSLSKLLCLGNLCVVFHGTVMMQDIFWAWVIDDLGQTILSEDSVIRYGIEEVGQAKSIVHSLQFVPVNIWSLNNISDDTASVWLQDLGDSRHESDFVVGVIKSLIREDEVEAAVLIWHVIEVVVIDTELLFWDTQLKGFSTVVLVFSLCNIDTNDNVELIEFEELLGDGSRLSSTARSKFEDLKLPVLWGILEHVLEHLLVSVLVRVSNGWETGTSDILFAGLGILLSDFLGEDTHSTVVDRVVDDSVVLESTVGLIVLLGSLSGVALLVLDGFHLACQKID